MIVCRDRRVARIYPPGRHSKTTSRRHRSAAEILEAARLATERSGLATAERSGRVARLCPAHPRYFASGKIMRCRQKQHVGEDMGSGDRAADEPGRPFRGRFRRGLRPVPGACRPGSAQLSRQTCPRARQNRPEPAEISERPPRRAAGTLPSRCAAYGLARSPTGLVSSSATSSSRKSPTSVMMAIV